MEIDGAQRADRLRGRQVPLLLAYLVLHRDREVGREELIGALWPDQAPASEDGALRVLLSRLRSALDPATVTGRDELTLALPDPVWVDLEAAAGGVRRAEQALEEADSRTAWALAQVPLNISARGLLPGASAPWIEPRRRELEDIRLQALEIVGRAGLGLGGSGLASAERAARSLIEREPYRESGYALLMQALALQGNVAEGLRVFDRLRRLLRDELGTLPSPETLAAHERLLRPEGRTAAPEGTDAGRGSRALAPPPELVARASGPLVGRRAEISALEELWQRARTAQPFTLHDSGRVVLLAGDPGIGKTRLVAELVRLAHAQGAYILAGRCPEETLVPYQPFLEALRHYVLGVPFSELRASAREYGSELSRLVPELRRRVPELPAPLAGEPETERYRLFEAVVGLLSEIAGVAPILLVLDDLQWADRPTLLLLRHLARALNPARLLILGAYRSTESELGGFPAALAELRRERLVTQLDVAGLSERETAELVEVATGVVPSRALVRALHAETEGNPFFIEEIVRHLRDAGLSPDQATAGELRAIGLPEGVREVIARRLGRLDDPAVEWLRTAAVIGRDFDLGLLEPVVALGEDAFLAALDNALGAGLVVELPGRAGRYSFAHALIRETLYHGMSAPRRARIHRRVAEALEAEGEELHLTAIALHLTRGAASEDAEKAMGFARRAADQAGEMLAHEEAVEHYVRALEVVERLRPHDMAARCELLLLLGEARVRAGERPLAWPVFREAASLAAGLDDSASLVRAAIGASRRYIQPPGVIDDELIALLEAALERTEGDQSLERIRLLGGLCGAVYYSPKRTRMRALASEATTVADALDLPEARAVAAATRRRAYWGPDHLAQRLADSTELLRQAREAGDLELELQGHAWLVVDLLEHGQAEAVAAQIDAFVVGAERLRQPLYLWNAAVWRAMRALMAGRLDEADRLAAEALAAGTPGENITASQYYAIQLLTIRREQDRMAELEAPARELVAANPHRAAWRAALITLLCETGRRDEARPLFDALAAADFADIPQDGDWLITITLLADCCFELADAERARVLYRLLEPYRDSVVVIGLAAACLGAAAQYLGRLAHTYGDDALAIRHFEAALRTNGELGAVVHRAHTQIDLAQALGRTSRGERLLEETRAEATATTLGLPAVARRAGALAGRR